MRRQEAEIGALHRTARRLAALFEHIIPSTPKLIAAYGNRVTEIVAKPNVNPRGSTKDGPFEPFVGADGTAMWAAATSGTPALAMYLLACFLARTWPAQFAIPLWVQLVEERRLCIRKGFTDGENVAEAAVMSTLQDISREDLAIWDASARSWLGSADQARLWQLKQLELVTKDAGIQFGSGPSTYAKIISCWQTALEGMEAFLCGLSQEITDASILVAFSAWHLFPDLLVLADEPTKVPFRDRAFPANVEGTIGLWPSNSSNDKGIKWSLTLSHLNHYGPQVQATGQPSSAKCLLLLSGSLCSVAYSIAGG